MDLKFVSLNLWHGTLLEEIIEFLKNQDADIATFQEVYDGHDPDMPKNFRTFEILKNRLDYPFSAFAPALIDKLHEGKVVAGNAILSKFPLTAKENVFFNEPFGETDHYDVNGFATRPRNLQHVEIRTRNATLNVFNMHGVWDLDGDNYSERRQKMSQVILDGIKGKSNVILAGDTNAKPTNKAMRAVEQELTSVFGDTLTTSFNMRRKDNPGYATAAVDMIFVSKNIEVINHSVPDVDISDHLPLIAKLRVP